MKNYAKIIAKMVNFIQSNMIIINVFLNVNIIIINMPNKKLNVQQIILVKEQKLKIILNYLIQMIVNIVQNHVNFNYIIYILKILRNVQNMNIVMKFQKQMQVLYLLLLMDNVQKVVRISTFNIMKHLIIVLPNVMILKLNQECLYHMEIKKINYVLNNVNIIGFMLINMMIAIVISNVQQITHVKVQYKIIIC